MKMKDKKSWTESSKQKHREQLKAQRRKEPNLERPVAELTENPLFLLFVKEKIQKLPISINSE